jgi:hypothetical protein
MEQLFQAQFQIGIHAERINRSGGCAKRGQTRSRQKIGVPGSFAKIITGWSEGFARLSKSSNLHALHSGGERADRHCA